jgi:predicted  nucleic acid-binding Zn-ribbon protein
MTIMSKNAQEKRSVDDLLAEIDKLTDELFTAELKIEDLEGEIEDLELDLANREAGNDYDD